MCRIQACLLALLLNILGTPYPAVPDSLNMRLVARWPYGSCKAVTGRENYAYINNGSTIQVLNMADPADIQLLGETDIMADVRDLHLVDNLLYVADGSFGLQIVDVADPANPYRIGRYTEPIETRSIFVSGNYAYLADADWGLRVIDISNPVSPVEVGALRTSGEAQDVFVVGSLAYLADELPGLRIIDVSDPTNPEEISVFDTPTEALSVCVSGIYAYVVDDGKGLRIIDISDPAAPIEVGALPYGVSAAKVLVFGSYAYLTGNNGYGLDIVDISDPTNPSHKRDYGVKVVSIHVSGNYIYAADPVHGLHLLEVTEPYAQVAEVGLYDVPENIAHAFVAGDYAYLADDRRGMRIFDISDPARPHQVCFYETPEWVHVKKIYVADQLAILAHGSKDMTILDISDPTAPVKLSDYEIAGIGRAADIQVVGNHIFIAASIEGFLVLDISDPANPVAIERYYSGGFYTRSLYVQGPYAYVTALWNDLWILDISQPTSVKKLDKISTPGYPWDIYVHGNYAYIADGWYGLWVIDVSDPTYALHHGNLNTLGESIGVDGSGALVFLADGNNGLRAIDVSNPAEPAEIGYYRMSRIPFESVQLDGDLIFSANGQYGFSILEYIGPPSKTRNLTTRRASGEIILSWSPNEGLNFSHYKVYRNTSGTFAAGDSVAAVTDTTWTDSGLTDGNLYYYAVSTVDEDMKEGALSNAVEVTFATGIEAVKLLPRSFSLSQNYPNPFNPETNIQFGLPQDSFVSLRIYGITGQVVRTLKSEKMVAGYHQVRWDGRDDNGRTVGSGVYFYRIEASGFSQTRRMVLLK